MYCTLSFLLQENSRHKILLVDTVIAFKNACVFCLLFSFKNDKWVWCLRNRKHVPCFYRVIETRVKV